MSLGTTELRECRENSGKLLLLPAPPSAAGRQVSSLICDYCLSAKTTNAVKFMQRKRNTDLVS